MAERKHKSQHKSKDKPWYEQKFEELHRDTFKDLYKLANMSTDVQENKDIQELIINSHTHPHVDIFFGFALVINTVDDKEIQSFLANITSVDFSLAQPAMLATTHEKLFVFVNDHNMLWRLQKLIKKTKTHTIFKLSELFLDPNVPFVKMITHSVFNFTIRFATPATCSSVIQYFAMEEDFYSKYPETHKQYPVFVANMEKLRSQVAKIIWMPHHRIIFNMNFHSTTTRTFKFADRNEIKILLNRNSTDFIIVCLHSSHGPYDVEYIEIVDDAGREQEYYMDSLSEDNHCFLDTFHPAESQRPRIVESINSVIQQPHMSKLVASYIYNPVMRDNNNYKFTMKNASYVHIIFKQKYKICEGSVCWTTPQSCTMKAVEEKTVYGDAIEKNFQDRIHDAFYDGWSMELEYSVLTSKTEITDVTTN